MFVLCVYTTFNSHKLRREIERERERERENAIRRWRGEPSRSEEHSHAYWSSSSKSREHIPSFFGSFIFFSLNTKATRARSSSSFYDSILSIHKHTRPGLYTTSLGLARRRTLYSQRRSCKSRKWHGKWRIGVTSNRARYVDLHGR
jgi:hypothetical protein